MVAPDRRLPQDEQALLARAAEWPGLKSLDDVTERALREITRDQGVDLATSVLFDRVVNSPAHGNFIKQVEHLRRQATVPTLVQTPLAETALVETMLAVAPGAFYVEFPHTGAGGDAVLSPAARCGCRTEVIPTASFAAPSENGRTICRWLSEQNDQRIILASLSKGGSDVKMALAQPGADRAFQNVVAWINVGGILSGSPMVRWILSRRLLSLTYRFLFWRLGYDFSVAADCLDRRAGVELDSVLQLPDHLRAIHVVGFPLRKHMSSRRARRWHRRLASFGPNEGVTLLSDVLGLPGYVLPVWGADHYFQKGWQADALIAALLAYLSSEFDLSAPAPSPAKAAP